MACLTRSFSSIRNKWLICAQYIFDKQTGEWMQQLPDVTWLQQQTRLKRNTLLAPESGTTSCMDGTWWRGRSPLKLLTSFQYSKEGVNESTNTSVGFSCSESWKTCISHLYPQDLTDSVTAESRWYKNIDTSRPTGSLTDPTLPPEIYWDLLFLLQTTKTINRRLITRDRTTCQVFISFSL